MQIKFVILTICASLATIGYAAPLVNIDIAPKVNINTHRIIGGREPGRYNSRYPWQGSLGFYSSVFKV
ncbi:hypothetical protein G6F70_002477 [Rhizopus microsporus]|uniref:Uncharacterized protein n=1 Tax=Rhizopus azygosporus TaxID=86630 RepID=A0A367JRJ5_RHIAZ|nr:hypothetical protein G6F71_002574 [Rhizopus microsporus]RCH92321.1 hypothetical protein CU097_012773 [Rhizopus azygosporus]KAG1202170.1 hypothetical protein G6F70_002477 [Rhizopus microsporus]KAG1216240.1 hypothetical protein G6F69_000295 [Rhizopus microsporus]KAG1236688.1 hypothetical protein G6F67_001810 [Rhizopus microsporus]